MIQSLRRRFILINMSSVTLVLLLVFGAMMLSTARQYQERITQSLTDALNNTAPDGGKHDMPEIGMREPGGKRADRFALPSFSVLLDAEGEATCIWRNNVSVSDAVIADAVAQAQSSGKSTGRLPGYDLTYAIRYSSAGDKLAFVDNSARTAALERQVRTSLLIGLFGLAAFFGVSVFLSDIALRPLIRDSEGVG